MVYNIKCICALIVISGIFWSCEDKAYYGCIYDYKSQVPIDEVEINDYLNNTQTTTDEKGFFLLKHEAKITGKLILKKHGYDIDTLETIITFSGEQFKERFKGDTIYLFKAGSNFRDSINRLK